MGLMAMCFCLLPVTGLNSNFVFPGVVVDWRILDISIIFIKSYLCIRIEKVSFGSIQQIWTIFENCH